MGRLVSNYQYSASISRSVMTVEQISNQYFSDLAIHFSERTISEKLPKEVGAVFAAYTRSELSHLGILGVEGTGNFIKSNPVEIPDLAFLFCLLYYRDKYSPGSSAINTEDICLAENSPGRVINLPEYQVRTILGNLHNAGLVRLEQLANLDQVRLSDSIDAGKCFTTDLWGKRCQLMYLICLPILNKNAIELLFFMLLQKKAHRLSLFCQKVCKQANGKYLDLLEFFIQSPALSENIDSFSPEKLRGLLIEQSQGQSLLVVDRADFLLDTWRKIRTAGFLSIYQQPMGWL